MLDWHGWLSQFALLMTSVRVRSFAKLNITLDVLNKRPDGYHNIESVVQSISLHDDIAVSGPQPGITVGCTDETIPAGGGNLAHRACVMFLEAAGLGEGVSIEIEKTIPPQAGLGGGSSNAAATLIALNEVFGHPLSSSELRRISAQLGSDVPFFLIGGTGFAAGRGDMVSSLPDCLLDYVIVKPEFGVSTGWAYSRLVEDRTPVSRSRAAAEACRAGDRHLLIEHMGNDFEEVVESESPEVADIRRELSRLGADRAMLAGSGSAVFGAFLSADSADTAFDAARDQYHRVFRARTVTRKEFGSCVSV